MNKQKIKKQVSKLNRKISFVRSMQWIFLAVLLFAVTFGYLSGFFAYEYGYFKCGDKPLELDGRYYRIPGDKGYGIHPSSDYHICTYGQPPGLQRDPTTKAGAKMAGDYANGFNKKTDYTIYVPENYQTTDLSQFPHGTGVETNFTITTEGMFFSIREMKKGVDSSYTELCVNSVPDGFTRKAFGKDNRGNEICNTHSRHLSQYNSALAVNVGNTSITVDCASTDKEKADRVSKT
jgi:hypothetical protein